MEITKLDIEIGNWTEEIAIAEVGEEGHFDVEGLRIFWRKWGTNPNEWEITNIMQISETTLEQIERVEQKFKDFGFLDNSNIKKQIAQIKNRIINNQQSLIRSKKSEPTKPPLQKMDSLQQLNKFADVTTTSTPTVPTIQPIPIPFKNAIPSPSPKISKGFTAFKQQLKKLFKFGRNQQIPSNNYEDWIVNVNLNIFKNWLKTGKLVNNINKTNNLVSSTPLIKNKRLTAIQKFKQTLSKLNKQPTSAKPKNKFKNFLKTGKWK